MMSNIPHNQFTSSIWQLFLRWVFPAALLVVTLASSLAGGMFFLGGDAGDRLAALRQAAPFAVSLLLAIGAHALGHYLVARRNGINAYPPYFIPAFSMSGTAGAYTKLIWPIEDRKALARIFTSGPIAGFIVSAAFFFVGVAMSEVTPHLTSSGIELGESLLTLSARHLLFPEMTANDDLILHPIGFAGWIGLYFNLWQLFPAGRLDGGRLVYALWGYRPTLVISWFTIAGLVALSTVWVGWLTVAAFAALTMIRLRRQYPIERHEERLDSSSVRLIWISLIVLALIFAPVPLKLSHQRGAKDQLVSGTHASHQAFYTLSMDNR